MLRRVCLSTGWLVISIVALMAPVARGVAMAAPIPPTNKPLPQTQGPVNNGNGLRISPVRNDLTIKPGQSQTIDVYLQNVTNSPAELKAIINDFVASDDESGQPRILLDENASAPNHSLKQYVDKIPNVSLQPQEQKIIKVRVAIPANAAGGGYFGAVRFAPTSLNSSKNVSLSASVASLLLVTVPGDIKEQVGIESFNVVRGAAGKASNFYTSGKDLNAVIRFKNTGNIQEQPFGKIVVKRGSSVVTTVEINNTTPRGSVLPDSIRRFTASLGDKTNAFGRYSVTGSFGYGDSGQLVTASTSFVVIPTAYVVFAVILLVLLVAALVVFPRLLKSHDRKLLRKVRRGGK